MHQSFKASQPVFLVATANSSRKTGIMDTELFEYEVDIHCSPVLLPVVIFNDPWRTPLTFHSRFRKPTACVRKSPQWTMQWTSLVFTLTLKVESFYGTRWRICGAKNMERRVLCDDRPVVRRVRSFLPVCYHHPNL